MASTPTKSPQEQAFAISAFANVLRQQLSSSTASSGTLAITDDTLRTLDGHLEQLPLYRTDLPILTRHQLDLKATEVWNTCVQLMATCGKDAERGLLSKVKLFAFGMIESVAPRRGSGNLKTLEIALKTVRDCLENGNLEPSLKVLETAATRLDTFERSGSNTDKSKLSIITTEYYTLRIYLSWLQGRPDIAEHLFFKLSNTKGSREQRNISMGVYYTIGASALSKNQFDIAVCWLERALESSSCPDQDIEQQGLALKDMRLLTLHAFVRAHLHQNLADSRGHILQALDSLKKEYRGIFPVIILQLEVFSKDAQPSYQGYFECLETAVRMMEPTDENLKIAFYHIQNLKSWSWVHSMRMSQQILLEKLVPSGHRAMVEQYFVILVWMITSHCTSNDLDTVADIAKKLTESGNDPLSEEAAHASLVLIWRKIESIISTGDLCMAERWCCFVLEQPIFQNCSIANRSIFQRKLVICALDNPNTSLAQGALNRILEQSQDTPSTLYLVYKISLRHQKYDIGTIALEALSKLGTTGTAYLVSCAAEAQHLGKTRQAMECLEQVIATLDCGYHEGLDIPALFQNTICIKSTEIERCKTENTELLERMCNVFEIALKHESNSVFSTNEIEWLFQKSYNLALRLIKKPCHSSVIRLLDISTKLADSYKYAPGLKDVSKLVQHYLSCNFLKVIILVSEARANTNPLEKGKYHEIRNTIQHFRGQIQQASDIKQHAKWKTSYRTLLSFDFEAAILLEQHDSLPPIIEECHTFVDEKLCALFLDSILASEAPISVMARVVMTIINTLHTSPSPSLNKTTSQKTLPRYLRCLFQLSIQANEFPLAEAILDKSLSLAREENNAPPSSCNGKRAYCYPNEELEWLATTAFNHAMDFYLASADEDCRRWAGKAIEIADEVEYNQGALGRLLRENLAKLP